MPICTFKMIKIDETYALNIIIFVPVISLPYLSEHISRDFNFSTLKKKFTRVMYNATNYKMSVDVSIF